MLATKERVEQLHKEWREAVKVENRDVTAEFNCRSKQRDLNASIKVWLVISLVVAFTLHILVLIPALNSSGQIACIVHVPFS